MTNTITLDQNYSTTRMVAQEKPEVVSSPEDKFQTMLFLPEGEGRKGEGGLRTKGYFKRSYEDKPLISIITVVFNGEKYLEETIKSVINQTYDNLEYIIIDGGSTDGTLDIIKKYEDKIAYWVSERDGGIYDAMNKGIDVASGDWINFMNAGDALLKTPRLNYGSDVAFIYGRAVIYEDKILKVKNKINIKDFFLGMVVCHQACFYRTKVVKDIKYDTQYKICADQKITALALKAGKALYSDDALVYYDMTGISSRNQFDILKEKIKLNQELGWPIYWPVLSYIKSKLIQIRDFYGSKYAAAKKPDSGLIRGSS